MGLIGGPGARLPLPEANGGLGAEPPAEAGDFCYFFEENNSFLGTTCCYEKGFKSVSFLTSKEIKSVKNTGCLFSEVNGFL